MKQKIGLRKAFIVDINTVSQIPILYFVLHCIFSMTISYFYTVTNDSSLISLVQLSYQIRRVCLVLGLLQIFFKLRIRKDCVFLVVGSGILYGMTAFLFPQNMKYVGEILPYLLLGIESYIFIRAGLVNWSLIAKWTTRLAKFFVIAVIVGILTAQHKAQYIAKQYMTFANALILPTGFVMFEAFCKNKIYDYGIALAGLMGILAFGSRGSFLLLAILLVVYVYSKSKDKKVLYLGAGFILILWIGLEMTGAGESVVANILGNSESRTLVSIFSGSLFKSARTRVYAYMGKCIVSDAFLGAGLCADRYYLPFAFTGGDANYAHNFFVEWAVDFGILGILLAIGIAFFIVRTTFTIRDNEKKWYMCVFFFLIFLQLMLSRSWTTEINLFVYVALLVNHRFGERIYEE